MFTPMAVISTTITIISEVLIWMLGGILIRAAEESERLNKIKKQIKYIIGFVMASTLILEIMLSIALSYIRNFK